MSVNSPSLLACSYNANTTQQFVAARGLLYLYGSVEKIRRHIAVTLRIRRIHQLENKIEPRKQRCPKPRIRREGRVVVVDAIPWIHDRDDRGSTVELADDSSLGDGKRLLLHRLVDCRLVLVADASKLVLNKTTTNK